MAKKIQPRTGMSSKTIRTNKAAPPSGSSAKKINPSKGFSSTPIREKVGDEERNRRRIVRSATKGSGN